MKRWGVTILTIVLICAAILMFRASGKQLFQDSDTKLLLSQLDHRAESGDSVLTWFTQDWPLGNHFYRPVTTLTFEFDRWLYGSNPAGFGLTNVLLIIGCLFALAWLMCEIRESRTMIVATVFVATLWILDIGGSIAIAAFVIAAGSVALSLVPGRSLTRGITSALLWVFVGFEATGIASQSFRMIGWLPGRTASTMALFALLSLAAYARFEIQASKFAPDPPPSAFGLPPSKTFVSPKRSGVEPYLWLALSWLCLAFALCSYEQAVMIPVLHIGVSWLRRRQGHLALWKFAIGSFAILGIYLMVRTSVLPAGISSYQKQQYWSSMGVVLAIADYVLPSFSAVRLAWISVLNTGYSLLFIGPYLSLLELASDAVSVFRMFLKSSEASFLFVASIVAFLPMAWFKPFDHYHFFPMLLRAGMFIFMLELGITALISAASHPAIRVPRLQHLEAD